MRTAPTFLSLLTRVFFCLGLLATTPLSAQINITVGHGFNTVKSTGEAWNQPNPIDSRVKTSNITLPTTGQRPLNSAGDGSGIRFTYDALDNNYTTDDGLMTWSITPAEGYQIDSLTRFGGGVYTANDLDGSPGFVQYQLFALIDDRSKTFTAADYTLVSTGTANEGLSAGENYFTENSSDFSKFTNMALQSTSTLRFRLNFRDTARFAPASNAVTNVSDKSWGTGQITETLTISPVTLNPVPEPGGAILFACLTPFLFHRNRKAKNR